MKRKLLSLAGTLAVLAGVHTPLEVDWPAGGIDSV
jgi:hypothetical protein